MEHLVYSQSPLDYTRFLASRINSLDILEPTLAETLQTIVALWPSSTS